MVVIGEGPSHFTASSEAVCSSVHLRLNVLMVGDDQTSGGDVPTTTQSIYDSFIQYMTFLYLLMYVIPF